MQPKNKRTLKCIHMDSASYDFHSKIYRIRCAPNQQTGAHTHEAQTKDKRSK